MSLPLTAEQQTWLKDQAHREGLLFFTEFIREEPKPVPPGEEVWEIKIEPNPCIRLFGKGPSEATCRSCKHLIRHGRYWKCFFRTYTRGPGSDHKRAWGACKRWEAS